MRTLRSISASLQLWKRAPSSASAAEDMTFCMMMLFTWIGPLSGVGRDGVGGEEQVVLRKKYPPTREQAP